jgi:hypothetical protein
VTSAVDGLSGQRHALIILFREKAPSTQWHIFNTDFILYYIVITIIIIIIILYLILILILNLLGIPSCIFYSDLPSKVLPKFIFSPYVLCGPPITAFLIYYSNCAWRRGRPFYGPCNYLLTSHLGRNPRRCMWVLWWTKWHCDVNSSSASVFPCQYNSINVPLSVLYSSSIHSPIADAIQSYQLIMLLNICLYIYVVRITNPMAMQFFTSSWHLAPLGPNIAHWLQ